MPDRYADSRRAIGRTLAAAVLVLVMLESPLRAETCVTAAQPAALDLLREQRVATIGYRLARAARAECDTAAPMTGMGLHDVSSYAEAYRPTIRNVYHMVDGFGVRFVVPGGAADRAGLRAGDEIVALDGQDLAGFAPELIRRDAAPDRTERFTAALRDVLRARPADLRIRRDGTQLSVQLIAEPGCGGEFVVAPDTLLNAWSDGSGVAVTARLVDFVQSDDELAFVLAHEMSHNILHHAVRTRGHSPVLASVGIGAGTIKATEIEADRNAVHLLQRAGYDPAGGEACLRRLARSRGPDFAFTHPGTTRRIALLRAAAAESATPGAR